MLPKHQDCAGCCEQGRCHFCLQAARHEFDDGRHSFACCAAHLLWLASNQYAPGGTPTILPKRHAVIALPAEGVTAAIRAQPTNAGVGERLLTVLGSLEPPAILLDQRT